MLIQRALIAPAVDQQALSADRSSERNIHTFHSQVPHEPDLLFRYCSISIGETCERCHRLPVSVEMHRNTHVAISCPYFFTSSSMTPSAGF